MSRYSTYGNTFSQKGPAESVGVPSTKSSTVAALKWSSFSPSTITSGGDDEKNPPILENAGVNSFNTLSAANAAMRFVISVSNGLAGIDDCAVVLRRSNLKEGLRGIFLSHRFREPRIDPLFRRQPVETLINIVVTNIWPTLVIMVIIINLS